MDKIHNVFIKHHQRGRWRYLSLLAQSVGARFPAPRLRTLPSVCPISSKNTSKTHRTLFTPLDGASVLACAYQLKVRSQNPKDFEHWFSQRLGKIRNVFIKQHQRGRWRHQRGTALCTSVF